MKRVEKGSDKALGCTLKKLGLKTCKVAGWIFGVLLLCLVSACSCLVEHSAEQPVSRPAPEAVQRLRGHVEQLCAQPRYGDTLEQARLYIEKKLAAAGWAVTLQEFTTSDGETHYNICALRRGKSGKRYIIGAHYDACDTGEGENPGADDNASAVAALLELAAQLPKGKPEHDIELVAWACEEPPWFESEDMGSARHAAACDSEKVLGLICLEMLGYFSDEPDSQPSLFPGYSLLLPSVGTFIAVAGNLEAYGLAKQIHSGLKQQLPAARINVPWAEETELFFSDHRNYHPLGIPAVMVTDTAMIRNPNYHEPTDTPDTLDYHRLNLVTRGLVRIVTSLAWSER